MGCGAGCAEGHSYGPLCQAAPPTPRRGGPVSGALRNRVTVYRPGKCANVTCTNATSEGQFGIITIENVPGGHRPVMLILCMPCVEAMQEATRG